MTSLQEATRTLVTRGTELGARIDGLIAAVEASRGRAPDALLDDAATVVGRAASRLRLSSDHTVVAIAGATGSGKSSTFNALTGLELSAVGVRRPTTSWATACIWGAEGAEEVLEWLGIPPRHQTTRDSMLDTRRETHALDGVVLLDLPDHDSTEVSHHLEVDRLVGLADLLIWVLDPQKYADAAIHDRYLAPMREHAEVMVVVLNHIDTVPEDRRQSMLDDVRRLVDADGLTGVPVIAISARQGTGLDELRARIEARVADKQLTRDRLEADLRDVAERLDGATGAPTGRGLDAARVGAADAALAEAAGVPVLVDAVRRSHEARVRRAVGWPLVAWTGRLRQDPLKRLQTELDLGEAGGRLSGSAASVPAAAGVAGGRVDAEVRGLVDDAARGLGSGWAARLQQLGAEALPGLAPRLERAVGGVDLEAARLPGWAQGVRAVQWLLLLGALGSLAWGLTGAASDGLPGVGPLSLPFALAIGLLVVGLVLGLVCGGRASGAADERAGAADERLRAAVAEVDRELVTGPLQDELARHAGVREALGRTLR
ncbi:50S ribosome-binding GTPase [Nocardioides sp. TRM66260-LWL]|uniref:GTPase n=1 Tax=Nocardioides sp. TRM66260-LWL TaxID=2874478 RepID=UPI001CC4EFE3|nr:GTPase [Nocardioides sp. TRM66260-LWL]MBZ5733002.1 50S ribosome-binding GTPase [Nocardioides sp. TRM66260-LWL]